MARVRKTLNDQVKPVISWKVGVYIRLSREDDNDERYSVKNQRQRLAVYLESLMLEETAQLIDYYIDDGYTGTDSDRDDFQRLLTDIDHGIVNCVLVKDLSRLSRNDWECKRYLQHLFVVKDIRFISLELPKLDSYKNPDDIYELGVSIQSMYNENHCRETSIKVRGTFNTKRRNGEFIGAFPPYCYLKDPADKHRFIVDDHPASIVRDIFSWFVYDGMSKNAIVKKLIGLGIACPSAYKQQKGMNYYHPAIDKHPPLWSARSISTILANQMYLGHMVQGKQKVKSYKVHTRINLPENEWFIVRNTHQPIIDEDLFNQAQALMRRDTRTAPERTQLYPFSGFLRCPDCGKAMGRRTAKNIVYYACVTYTQRGACTRHSIRHDRLEAAVLQAIQKQIALIDGMAQLIDELNDAPVVRTVTKCLDASLKRYTQELEKTSPLRTGLYMDWKNGDITREEYHQLKKEIEEKEHRLKKEIDRLQVESQDYDQGVISNNPYFDAFLKHKNIKSLNRGIIVQLIKTIHIHEGGSLTIAFNFADQHRRIVEFIHNNKK
ncbi:MAG: recombinase family protein [Lachnospiraceae bacterium]|nr:recombinase family protein [Lachnospiraceae bacterium]